MIKEALEKLFTEIQYDNSKDTLSDIVFSLPGYVETAETIVEIVAKKNSVTHFHPIDDLRDVMCDPDNMKIQYRQATIEDTRLEKFMFAIVVAIIAVASKYYNGEYYNLLNNIFNNELCNYLASCGRSLAALGYDETYKNILDAVEAGIS